MERLTVTETAAAVRQSLKGAFPGVKFAVRSDRFSGGSAVRVTFPAVFTPEQIKKVNEIIRNFEGVSFDGRDDSTHYSSEVIKFNGEDRRIGSSYVQAQAAF